jgi:hypothetical protein
MNLSYYVNNPWIWRFGLALALDALSIIAGNLPVVGFFLDAFLGLAGTWLWGPVGALQFLEPVTKFVNLPSLTISGIIKYLFDREAFSEEA